MINLKKLTTIILIFGSSLSYSQNWVFRWTSTFKPTSVGFTHSSYESVSNEFFFFSPEQNSAFSGAVTDVWSTFDHFIDIYELNEKWLFGFGFGRNVYFTDVYASVISYNLNQGSQINQSLNFVGRGEGDGRFVAPLKFSLSAKRELKAFRSRINQSIAFHLDFLYNNTYGEYLGPQSQVIPVADWYYIEITTDSYAKGLFGGRLSSGVSLRYEIEFLTKKRKNLLNLNFTYAQGFNRDYASIRFDAYGLDGYGATDNEEIPYMLTESFSRGSNFSIGISKSISFNLFKIKQNKIDVQDVNK
ncbi:MAG: hypothetical protein JJT77_08460 [Crocinitomicaceae bacterium]|nr:hypothetical protein [Crocinitomicaceae bacterium]